MPRIPLKNSAAARSPQAAWVDFDVSLALKALEGCAFARLLEERVRCLSRRSGANQGALKGELLSLAQACQGAEARAMARYDASAKRSVGAR